MKTKYKKYTNLYMYYLGLHHASILREIFGFKKALCFGSWYKLKHKYKIVMTTH